MCVGCLSVTLKHVHMYIYAGACADVCVCVWADASFDCVFVVCYLCVCVTD